VTSLVRRYLKTGVFFLVVGLAIGVWMMMVRELGSGGMSNYVASAHTHAILVGFVMMMILGVALWMFPRPAKGDTAYRPVFAEAAYWMLAIGTGARVVGELARAHSGTQALRWLVVATGVAQAAGLLLFFFNMRSRIRPAGSQAREAGGERF
jgi:cbb3-type cytochrome oxidase subunit 1